MHSGSYLRSHGMSDDTLTVIYKAVVLLAKILHAISACWGFTTASDRQRIEAVVRRGVRLEFHRRDDPSIGQLVDVMDETLFATVLRHCQHVLRYILPENALTHAVLA